MTPQMMTRSFTIARRVPRFATAILLVVAGSLVGGQGTATAADPDLTLKLPVAPRVLPEETLLYLRLDDAAQLRIDFAESSLGQMLEDPKMRPFATDVYALAAELFQRVGNEMGIRLDEFLAIPHGQAAVAMLPIRSPEDPKADRAAPKDDSPEAIRERNERQRRQNSGFSGVAMIDAGENVDQLLAIIDRIEQRMLDSGFVRREERVAETTVVRLLPPREGRSPVEYFQRGGNVVFGVGHRTATDVLDRWLENRTEKSLADSADFAAVMGHSLGAEETHPQATFYVDPYRIVERVMKRGGAAALVWPIVEDLGIAKIRGAGGSIFRGGETFDDLSHFHVLIDTPRDGFFGILRPATGDTAPPDWVPADVATYSTVHWKLSPTVDNLERIIDRFRGEGAFQRQVVSGLKESLDVDLRDDLLATLTGRYVGIRWLEPPIRINSQSQVFAFELSDAAKGDEIFGRIRARRPDAFQSEVVGGKNVYFVRGGPRNLPSGLRQPEPNIMFLGNWVLYSDSRKLVERVLRADNGNIARLVEEPDYALVSAELGGKLAGETPFFISYVRSSEFIRQLYEMTKSEETHRFLRSAGENNPLARRVYDLLRRNSLPPYEEFKKYFAPGGMFGYDESNGIHIGSFTLRPLDR